ncbi:MAG TPA: beta-ketoacyl synthase N-terminal-like domain-containing protein [Chthoniobacteraceae bacterium]|nr:beta-ketoacyl synthase N-terminal-like domain-containing protein [Chthoniobacteraceae bacterium]
MSNAIRIAITGAGAVCGAGKTADEILDAVVNGRSAIAPITQWDSARWPVRVASEVTLDNRALVPDRKLHKSIGRTDMLGLYASEQAVQQSGLLAHRDTLEASAVAPFNDRTGIISGSGGGMYSSSYEYLGLYTAAGNELPGFGRELGNFVNPMWLLKNLPNNVLCHTGIRCQFKGANTCVTNHCAGGAMSVAESAAAIRAGEADRMLAVGHDTPLEPESVIYYNSVGLLSQTTPRPFDQHRDGTVFGDGSGAVMLEEFDSAKARGATVLGEFLGAGCLTEGRGILDVREDGEGVARVIALALTDAGLSPADIGMIVAHGTGTRASDASEARGIRRVFGDNVPPVTAFKWAYGHTIAASGSIDLVVALAALRAGVVPGIATLGTLDAGLSPLPVSPASQKPRANVALLICRAFSGMNVALVIRAGTNP